MKTIQRGLFFFFALFALSISAKQTNSAPSQWKQFHCTPGNCNVHFPQMPQHIKQQMALSESGEQMEYDIYVSSEDMKVVFLMLVAQYPLELDQEKELIGLEGFLSGITHNEQNELLVADVVDVQGHKALDFFIKNNGRYFKGRAILANSKLYLLAMECEQQDYKEDAFDHFVSSFNLLD